MSTTTTKVRAVNTKKLSAAVTDFVKLYNIDITTASAIPDKKAAEKELISIILDEANKYEG